MRRLLYSLVVVSVLLLAGFAGVRAGDVPGDTVPDGDYQMWLPVVDNNYIWSNEYSMCPWRVAEVVLDGIAYSPYATMTYTSGVSVLTARLVCDPPTVGVLKGECGTSIPTADFFTYENNCTEGAYGYGVTCNYVNSTDKECTMTRTLSLTPGTYPVEGFCWKIRPRCYTSPEPEFDGLISLPRWLIPSE